MEIVELLARSDILLKMKKKEEGTFVVGINWSRLTRRRLLDVNLDEFDLGLS